MHDPCTERKYRRRALPVAAMAGMLTALALPAFAANFTPPQGCKLEVTVQNRSCTVSQHYRCTGDAPGDQWVTTYTQDGPVYQSRIDRETRWMESTNLVDGITDVLEDDAKDHASFSTLLETGKDDFDFWTRSATGERLHHIGQDILTGEKTEIDGVALEGTRFKLTTYSESGDVLIQREGQQYISRTQGRFYGGVERSQDWTGERQNTNDSPVKFSFPGQPGFGETKPQYDCDLQMVGGEDADAFRQLLKEARS